MEKIKILKTNDYSRFKLLKGSRDVKINDELLERFKKSFQESWVQPITVTKNYEIVDGQTRFTAAKMLNFPIAYVIME